MLFFLARYGYIFFYFSFFFLMIRRPPRSTLFPYTTALPICKVGEMLWDRCIELGIEARKKLREFGRHYEQDRKSTRLNSSHPSISYAVFCLKKKKNIINQTHNDTFNNHTSNIAYALDDVNYS